MTLLQQIIKIEPIPNTDNIELASVKGWKVIIRKGEFNKGSFCVFCLFKNHATHNHTIRIAYYENKDTAYVQKQL